MFSTQGLEGNHIQDNQLIVVSSNVNNASPLESQPKGTATSAE